MTIREAGRILGTPAGSGKSTTRTTERREERVLRSGGRQEEGHRRLEGKPLSLETRRSSRDQGVVDTYQTREGRRGSARHRRRFTGLGDDAYIEDLGVDLHALVGERVVSVEMHNYRYPEPLTKEQIQQKEEDAARLVIGRLSPT